MKKILTFSFILVAILGQAQWSIIHQGSIDSNDRDVFFTSEDTGHVIGIDSGGSYVLRTQNGGANWDSLWYDDHQFSTVHFPSADTGYISCFYENQVAVMRTIDGGDSRQRVASNLASAVSVPYAISFFDNNTGVINLQNYTAKTSDAGVNWTVLENFPGGGYRDGDIGELVFIQLGSALIGWTLDLGITFDFDTLNYQGSHNFLKVRDSRFVSSAIGQGGTELGYPNGSFGIITIGNVLTKDWKVNYFPYLSRVHGVSWPSENILYAVHRSIYSEGNDVKFFMKSLDCGLSWSRQETVESGYHGTWQIFCPNDTVCYGIGGLGGRIYKTTNGGGPLLDEVEQIVLSVKEIKDDLNFSIAPNPTDGLVTISSEKEPIKEVKVFNLQGKQIAAAYPNDFNATIDLTKYEAGVYLLQIMAGDKIRTGKIVREQ